MAYIYGNVFSCSRLLVILFLSKRLYTARDNENAEYNAFVAPLSSDSEDINAVEVTYLLLLEEVVSLLVIVCSYLLLISQNYEPTYLNLIVPMARVARISQLIRLISSQQVVSSLDVGSSPVDQLVIFHARRPGVI